MKERTVDEITRPAVHRIAALLDRDDPYPSVGDVLPRGWHAVFCPTVARHAALGADGHPERGTFFPPLPGMRRMAAGVGIEFHGDLRVGDEVWRDAEIVGIESKDSRSGTMVFVTYENRLHGPRGLAVTERQTAAFIGRPASGMPPAPKAEPRDYDWEDTVVPDAVMAFRLAALSFTGHRIHFDADYAREAEGFVGAVSSAGLHTLLIFETVRRRIEAPVARFTARNLCPVPLGRPIRLCGSRLGDTHAARVAVLRHDGALAVVADLEFEPC